ncbi:MAG TPA: tetratricopeptide repeat protein, partial [Vicinamibacterales bacterium]|nr:tetratricopeptide repeat protein [Vicinamibacterales bacterium]
AEALPHLKAAVKENPDNEVAHYQLAQAYRALGNTAEQEKALAEFNRVRNLAAARTAAVPQTKRDVTPQSLDIKPPK